MRVELIRHILSDRPGGGPVIVTAQLGTTLSPSSGGSNLNPAVTWVLTESRPVESTLKALKVYCTGAGTFKLKILTPTSGGFNITEVQTLNCSIGLNSFSVVAATLNEVIIPANAMLGWFGTATVSYASDTTAYSPGYGNATGELTGNNKVITSFSYQHQIQIQYTIEYTRVSPSTYLINEDCSGTVLPAWGVNNTTNPWTFSAGKLTSAGTGLTNFFDFYPTSNGDRNNYAVEFEFTGASDRFAIYRKPILNDAGNLTGTIGEVDLVNNRILLYASWQGGTTYTLPAVYSTLTLTQLTLAVGVRYRVELNNIGKVINLKITDTTNNSTETLSADGNTSKVVGWCYGRPGFAAIAGVVDVRNVKFGATNINPKFLICGDSITEGSGVGNFSDTLGYAALSILNGNGRYSGEGGSLLTNIIRRMRHELRFSLPQYVIIESVNNSNSDVNTTLYQSQIVDIYDNITNQGITCIVGKLSPNSNATQNARAQTINAFLDGKAWNKIGWDVALSVGGDGETYNAALMADGIHPNTEGHALMKLTLKTEFSVLSIS